MTIISPHYRIYAGVPIGTLSPRDTNLPAAISLQNPISIPISKEHIAISLTKIDELLFKTNP